MDFSNLLLAILRRGGPEMFFRFLEAGDNGPGAQDVPRGTAGYYDPNAHFQTLLKDALNLGLAPPQSPSLEELLGFNARAWPRFERKAMDAYRARRGADIWEI